MEKICKERLGISAMYSENCIYLNQKVNISMYFTELQVTKPSSSLHKEHFEKSAKYLKAVGTTTLYLQDLI